MESPKKGRFDDFEFELENSKHELPVRRTRANAQRQPASSSSAEAGLPRSKNINDPQSHHACEPSTCQP